MGRIVGAGHTAINVRNVTESRAFYGGIIGLPLSDPVAFDGYRITYAELPDGSKVELFDYDTAPPEHGALDDQTVGLRHLAFKVKGLDEWAQRLAAFEVPLVLGITELPTLGVRVMLFLDPNGVTLELAEPLAR